MIHDTAALSDCGLSDTIRTSTPASSIVRKCDHIGGLATALRRKMSAAKNNLIVFQNIFHFLSDQAPLILFLNQPFRVFSQSLCQFWTIHNTLNFSAISFGSFTRQNPVSPSCKNPEFRQPECQQSAKPTAIASRNAFPNPSNRLADKILLRFSTPTILSWAKDPRT